MKAIAFPFLFFVFLLNSCGKAEERNEFAANLAPLLDPAKLDSLKGKRAATPRLRKICYWLSNGQYPDAVFDHFFIWGEDNGYTKPVTQKTDRGPSDHRAVIIELGL
jgi:hypothetical protein